MQMQHLNIPMCCPRTRINSYFCILYEMIVDELVKTENVWLQYAGFLSCALWTFMPQTAAVAKMCSVCINWFLWFTQFAMDESLHYLLSYIKQLALRWVEQFNRVNSKVTKKPYNKNPYVAHIHCNILMPEIAVPNMYRVFPCVSYATNAHTFNETIRLWLWC